MSGWQRLGVVISVLWLLGAPLYFIAAVNEEAGKVYGMCYSTASSLPKTEADRTAAKAGCLAQLDKMGLSVPKLLNTLYTESSEPRWTAGSGSSDRALLWGLLLGPLVIFWMLGGLISGTVRWVARGFQHS